MKTNHVDNIWTIFDRCWASFLGNRYSVLLMISIVNLLSNLNKEKMKNYGIELILDLHECNPELFTKYYINKFFKALCKAIDMEACKVTFWEYKTKKEFDKAPPHLKGVSAVQFISTSNITIHALSDLKAVYLNIFSCKDFDSHIAGHFCSDYFEGRIYKTILIARK